MPSTELVTVNLTRENEKEEWGFELTGGGRDKNVRLYIESVNSCYPAFKKQGNSKSLRGRHCFEEML